MNISAYVTYEVSGLNPVTELVEITLNKQRHSARGRRKLLYSD